MPSAFPRLVHIQGLIDQYGIEETARLENMKIESVHRYEREYRRLTNNRTAKIGLLDIETAPVDVYVWQLKRNDYIHIQQIVNEWFMLCWRGKWLFGDEVFGGRLTAKEAIGKDDQHICNDLWKFLDEADIIIGHNVENFDIKKANARMFIKHGLPPYSPIQTIDTLKQSRRIFGCGAESHKLDWLCRKFGLPGKYEMGFQYWRDCIGEAVHSEVKTNDKNVIESIIYDKKIVDSALQTMYEYCGNDTSILEELYLKLRPYMKSHPNLNLYMDGKENHCSHCGSDKLQATGKAYFTPAGKYQCHQCKNCGAFVRMKSREIMQVNEIRSLAR